MSTKANTKEKNEKHKRILQNLLKLPDNQICADCTAKGPLWAAVNHGVFICIRCAGIHRGMGTHISKVKSVTLDSWSDDQVETMVNMGNRRANEILEANFPANKSKPGENASPSIVEQYCRAKYEKKLWVGKSTEQNSRPQAQPQQRPQRQPIHQSDDFKEEQSNGLTFKPVPAPVRSQPQATSMPRETAPQPIVQPKSVPSNDLISFDGGSQPSGNNFLEDLVTSGFSNQPTQQKGAPPPKQNILSLFDAPQQAPIQPQQIGRGMTIQQPYFGQQMYPTNQVYPPRPVYPNQSYMYPPQQMHRMMQQNGFQNTPHSSNLNYKNQ